MNNLQTEKLSFKNFFYNKKIAIVLWFGLSFIGIIQELWHHYPPNNFLIFKGVFEHTLKQVNLFAPYPNEYADVNHYGPTFSILFAPFALLGNYVGCVLWVLFNAAILYVAIRQIPIQQKFQNAILVFSAQELMVTSEWEQSNALICACLILAFTFINKEKEIWALLFIALATFIKLYGIVGLSFFFFSNNKIKFIVWGIVWSIVLFVLPMAIASPHFIIQSYVDWYNELLFKAAKNVRLDIDNDYQDISVMGIIRRLLGITYLKNYLITIPAVLLFFSQYIQWKYFTDLRFKLYMLCLVLIMTVIFTTSAESPTYIIAFPAVCIWYVLQENKKWINIVFVFALILTSFSYSDIFTPYVRDNIVRPYSLKALPCFIIWLIILIQMWKQQFLLIDKNKLTTTFT